MIAGVNVRLKSKLSECVIHTEKACHGSNSDFILSHLRLEKAQKNIPCNISKALVILWKIIRTS